MNYTYDAVGNRKQITSTLAPIPAGLFNYNANDQFTAGDTYDADGNTVSSGSIANTYDFENHLIQKGGVSILYDGDGNRVAKTVAGVTTTYLVDTLNPTGYAQVIGESFSPTSSNSEVSHNYVYGLELISQTRKFNVNSNGNTQQIFYAYDGHGSVRALTNTSGAVTDTYDYDAFGNLIHSTGSTLNNYLFAGEQFDPDLGLYYNRARYLNTSTGRFLTPDLAEGRIEDPLTLHRYLYAGNGPTNASDPSGTDFISDFETGLEVQRAIGRQFFSQFGASACVDQQIINILESACDAAWEVGLSFPGGLRPDLANIQTGALFEIKPIKSAADGLPQLLVYGTLLKLADPRNRNWHLGNSTEFKPISPIPLSGARVAYVAPPIFGVIVYFVADAKDAFDLSLLLASRIIPAILSQSGAAAVAQGSNVISISRGTSIANAGAQAEGAEIEQDALTDTLEDVA